jgi:hypothetical protein
MKLNYDSEKYEPWTSLDTTFLSRKLVYETAFDGIVKIYFLKSNDSKVNLKLDGKYFGDFIHHANCGIFLRMFENKTSWPKTSLVYIDFAEYYLDEISVTKSSWNVWKGNDLGYGKHLIEISPTETVEYKIRGVH